MESYVIRKVESFTEKTSPAEITNLAELVQSISRVPTPLEPLFFPGTTGGAFYPVEQGEVKGMEELKVSIKYQNLDELKGLLQKVTDQVEQLQKTLQEIEEFKPVTIVD